MSEDGKRQDIVFFDVSNPPAPTDARPQHVDADMTVTLALSGTQHQALLARGLTITRHVDVAEQTARIVVVARDASSGTVGSVFVAADKVRNAR